MSNRLRMLHLALAACGFMLAGCAPNLPPPKAPSQPQPQAQLPLTPTLPSTLPPSALLPQNPKVALLLPLSGQNASLGRTLMNAAEMGVFDSAGDDFSLEVRDSSAAGGPGGAVRDAMGKGAHLVLGPLFSTEIPAAAAVDNGQIPIISFSNNQSAAQPNVFILGIAPEAQVQRVVAYAAGRQLKRFAILYPDSPYGNAVRQAYQDAVVQAGGQVAVMQAYNPTATDFVTTMQALGASYKNNGFDALMIPEGGQKLRAIAAMLPGFDIPVAGPSSGDAPQPAGSVRLLGTALWNDPALAQDQVLAGGWFANTPPDRWTSFAQRYRSIYGTPPDQRTGVVYDAVTLAIALAKAKPGGDFNTARLIDPSGFAGVTGLFRLNPDGTTTRGLAVLEITPSGISVRDPAPLTFAAAIN